MRHVLPDNTPLKKHCEENGIAYFTILARMHKGMSQEEALKTEKKPAYKHFLKDGTPLAVKLKEVFNNDEEKVKAAYNTIICSRFPIDEAYERFFKPKLKTIINKYWTEIKLIKDDKSLTLKKLLKATDNFDYLPTFKQLIKAYDLNKMQAMFVVDKIKSPTL